MRPTYIQRKVPRYSTISFIQHYAYINDYPKNSEKFIWGIPSKYTHLKDREISAIVCAYIYDGTEKSMNAVREVDAMFKGRPFDWMAGNGHSDMMLEQNQMRQIYGRITVADLYWFFRELRTLYSQYGSIYRRFKASSLDTLQQNIEYTLSVLTPFNGKSVEHLSRRNLYFIIMAHCYDDYRIDESQLIAPLYERMMYPCKLLKLIGEDNTLCKDTATELTDNLRWFSERNPITFWVGILGYIAAVREKDKKLQTLAKSGLIRHRLRKR